MALQEFLASYAVKVDEDGARRLQRILDQNQKSASDLTSSFTSARRALSLLKAELSDASGLKDIFVSLSSGFSNLSLPKLSGDALSSLGGSAGSMSLKVTADTSAASEALESFRVKAEALRPKLSANATGITSAVSSAIAAVRSMMSSVSITIPVKAKATLDTSGLSAGSSGSSGASGSSPGTLVMGSVGRKLGIGGRVDQPTVAMIAEEGDPEYVIPVRNESRALPLLRSMLGELSESARLSLSGMLAESPGKSSLASAVEVRPSVKETLSMLTGAARSSFGLSGGGQPVVSHSVQAPVNITVNAAAAPAEAVGQVIYDTTRRSLAAIKESRYLCKVVTSLRTYDDMLLSAIDVLQDETCPEGWTGTLTFTHASKGSSSASHSEPAQVAPPRSSGSSAAKNVGKQSGSVLQTILQEAGIKLGS